MSKIITNLNRIKEILNNHKIDKIYPSNTVLEGALKSGKRLIIYHGIDPTGPQLHLGHSTNCFILREFQRLGHQVILLIGDFTAMIGDPTGKSKTRKPLTRKEALINAKGYKKQLEKVLDFNSKGNPIKIKFNSSWLNKLTFKRLTELSANFTVQQMIIRDMFQKRIKNNQPVSLHEFLYPIMQGYDSVAMDVDMEVGGTDQTFNMLIGRDLVRIYNKKEKFVLTTKLLIDPNTNEKIMNKSEGRYIALNDSPKEMYGKVMALPDEMILTCLELCTEISLDEIRKIKKELISKQLNPRDAKARLAREIVSIHHNRLAARKAEKEFNRVFKLHQIPADIKTHKLAGKKINILDLLARTGLASSKSEAKRLVEQGAVKIDNLIVKDWRKEIISKKETIIRVGKMKFVKII
jgi:tyrosyl-tRNA synthetase